MNAAEVRETGHLLQNLGWTELFAYLCPGAITLMSFTIWFRPDLAYSFGPEFAGSQFVIAISFLLVSYSVGLIVAAGSGAGAQRYLSAKYRREAGYSFNRVRWLLLWFFHRMPTPRLTERFVEARIRIQEELELYGGLPGLSQILSSWQNLATYRSVVVDRLPRPVALLMREAESVHRRRLFALGVAFAFMLLAVQAFGRLILFFCAGFGWGAFSRWCKDLPAGDLAALSATTILGALASFALRQVAGRAWEYEFLLTCSLTAEHPNPPVGAAETVKSPAKLLGPPPNLES